MQGGGLEWLFPFQDGHPPVGWADAAAYLVLPVLLVASQYASQKIISASSNSNDPAQQQSQAILKFLPLMIGGCGGGWSVGVGTHGGWFGGESSTESDVGTGYVARRLNSMLNFLTVETVTRQRERKPSGDDMQRTSCFAAHAPNEASPVAMRLGRQPAVNCGTRARRCVQLPIATLLTRCRPSLALPSLVGKR